MHTPTLLHLVILSLTGAALGAQSVEMPPWERQAVDAARALAAATVQVGVEVPETTGFEVMASGFVWDGKGLVVTAASVIGSTSESRTIVVVDAKGRRHPARLRGSDPATDVALLEVESPVGSPMRRGTGLTLEPGRSLYALGSPFGLKGSLLPGIVSGTRRVLVGDDAIFTGIIQTTAPVNPGDVGGPVANGSGELVGMIFSTYGRSPSEVAARMEERLGLLESGGKELAKLQDGALAWLHEQLGKPPVAPSGADKPSKIMETLSSVDDMIEGVRQHGIGFIGREVDFLGTQGLSFVQPIEQIAWVVEQLAATGSVVRGFLGIEVDAFPDESGAGVRVLAVTEGGPAALAGLMPGDVVVGFGGEPIASADDLHGAVSFTRPGDRRQVECLRPASPGQHEKLSIDVTLGERLAPDDR